MRRWNGWGEESTSYPFPESAARYLASLIGAGQHIADSDLDTVLASVPDSRLPDHPLVQKEPLERLYHARGQSLPDWVDLRHGRIDSFPDGVAYPASGDEVRALFDYARQAGARLIPYGGGTSVVGHINPLPGDAPSLTVALSRLDQLLDLDETSRLATFGAGVSGPRLEEQLNRHAYTLGHFPQSFELSTLGGWIATRSSGQQSYHYGRIENLFAGGRLETPAGPLELPNLPASAAGPDLRQLILGSEGRLGIITQASVRVRRLPQVEAFYGVFFRDWESGVEAVRQIVQAGMPVSMARLSNPQETDTTLRLSGKDALVARADRGLRLLGYAGARCLLIYGVTGDPASVRLARRQVNAAARAQGGLFTGTLAGKTWRKSRFLTPYLRNTLWERGYAIDTLETAVPWSRVLTTEKTIQEAMHAALAPTGERLLSFAHLSHVYKDGASVYVTYLFRRSPDPDETLERWRAMKTAASQAIIAQGGTISHQHGVGLDHAPYLEAEKGPLGMHLLREAMHALDPEGLLNPGKLLE
ncbi:MAG: FAD-binding oxidoreductase [Anaerolineales bacterium]|nr:FAD-binding oxidoreductase [Anaerolineales bacterium]